MQRANVNDDKDEWEIDSHDYDFQVYESSGEDEEDKVYMQRFKLDGKKFIIFIVGMIFNSREDLKRAVINHGIK